MEEKTIAVKVRMTKRLFEFGELSKIARLAGISRGYLNNLLSGERKANGELASRLVKACATLGNETSVFDWSFPNQSTHPAFRARKNLR